MIHGSPGVAFVSGPERSVSHREKIGIVSPPVSPPVERRSISSGWITVAAGGAMTRWNVGQTSGTGAARV